MVTLPFPFLCFSKPVHLHPILYCGYGYSAVGRIALRKQCFGSKLQTLKMSRGASSATLKCVYCASASPSSICVFKEHNHSRKSKEDIEIQTKLMFSRQHKPILYFVEQQYQQLQQL